MNCKPTKAKAHYIINSQVGIEKGQIADTTIKGLVVHPDDRGHFAEIFRTGEAVCAGFEVKQSSLTMTRPGVIKAFHFHCEQDDIFVPVKGIVRIALLDFREGSPTYGIANSVFAGELYLKAVRIPKGVAHGYEVLGNDVMTMVYYTNQHYNPKDEFRQAHDDPEIGFVWWGVHHR
ncbi:MAG: dTDP-4-dehydrorhamnose 3,5-epimerase family protein [Planctomycetota bacterium]